MNANPTIPTGNHLPAQADLIAAALTGDTAKIQRRLDEIADDETPDE